MAIKFNLKALYLPDHIHIFGLAINVYCCNHSQARMGGSLQNGKVRNAKRLAIHETEGALKRLAICALCRKHR